MFSSCRPGKTQEEGKESFSKGRARIHKKTKHPRKARVESKRLFPIATNQIDLRVTRV